MQGFGGALTIPPPLCQGGFRDMARLIDAVADAGIVVNNTPEKWERFLRQTKAWPDQHPESHNILTLNSWNEWVEGSYVEPDKKHGTKHLDAVKAVSGTKTGPVALPWNPDLGEYHLR